MMKEKRSFVAEAYEWIEMMVLSLVLVVFVFSFLFRVVSVKGSSMNPTLNTGDRVIVSNVFYTPEIGDIVVFSIDGHSDPYIKRVIATAGHTVNFDPERGCLVRDGKAVEEPFIYEQVMDMYKNGWYDETNYPIVVPEGYIFVMGDNRNNSLDSRYPSVGLVDVRTIIGHAVFTVFPLRSAGLLIS